MHKLRTSWKAVLLFLDDIFVLGLTTKRIKALFQLGYKINQLKHLALLALCWAFLCFQSALKYYHSQFSEIYLPL